MMTTVFTGLAVLFLLLAVQPFATYPATLWLVRAVRGVRPGPVATPAGETLPSFAICMSAYNEERVILTKVRNLLTLRDTVPDCQLHIYVDAGTDQTAELLEPYRDRVNVIVGDVRQGKSHGLNVLMRQVTADVVVFTDANVELHPDALVRIGPWFADPGVGCVSGHLIYLNSDETATAASGSLYWKVEEAIRQLESDVFSVIGADGSLFAIRRSLHVAVPPDIIDDFYVSMKILCDGHRVVREAAAIAYERSATSGVEEFRRKVRIACQAFNVHRLIWPQIRRSWALAYCYTSHRFLKWVIIYNLGLSALFLLAAALTIFPTLQVFATMALALIAFVGLLLAGFHPARQVVAILSAFAGAGWGVWRSLRGDRFQTWTPTQTARGPVVGRDTEPASDNTNPEVRPGLLG
jgi:cellulose synthase/poly-beta-1,6-N-acetylglucosamine synthase-like glycosyltransferase